METLQIIMAESLSETEAIFGWLTERGESPEEPLTVLIGGWAVYSYNMYYGSTDIDLITNSNTRSTLNDHLVHVRGYGRDRDAFTDDRYIYRQTEGGRIRVDFASREDRNRFEGRDEDLPFSMLDGNTTVRPLGSIHVPVPTRSLLLLMKMKAAWDRSWRLSAGKSGEPGYERGKVEKDHSDILALIDIDRGGGDLEIAFLGRELNRRRFLFDVLDRIEDSTAAAVKYDIDAKRAREMVSNFKRMVIEE